MRRSSRESPEPSTILTPAVGIPAFSISAVTTAAPRAVVPGSAVGGAELLQQHLGGEVVAVLVHEPDDLRAAAAECVGRQPRRLGWREPEPDLAGDE